MGHHGGEFAGRILALDHHQLIFLLLELSFLFLDQLFSSPALRHVPDHAGIEGGVIVTTAEDTNRNLYWEARAIGANSSQGGTISPQNQRQGGLVGGLFSYDQCTDLSRPILRDLCSKHLRSRAVGELDAAIGVDAQNALNRCIEDGLQTGLILAKPFLKALTFPGFLLKLDDRFLTRFDFPLSSKLILASCLGLGKRSAFPITGQSRIALAIEMSAVTALMMP